MTGEAGRTDRTRNEAIVSSGVLEIDASLADIARIRAFVMQRLAQLGAPANSLDRGALVIDELCTNSLAHGYRAKQGYMRVEVDREGSGYCMQFIDRAEAFDPTSVPTAPVSGDIGDRPVGGLGLHLVRESVREFRYSRDGQENRITVSFD